MEEVYYTYVSNSLLREIIYDLDCQIEKYKKVVKSDYEDGRINGLRESKQALELRLNLTADSM